MNPAKKLSFRSVLGVLPILLAPLARADYSATVLADGPKAYFRFNDDSTRTITNKNLGTLGAAGNATNDLLSYKKAGVYGTDPTGVVHPFPGAIVGDRNRAEFFDYTTRTIIPFTPALNPPNTQPFTVEAWLYPPTDQNNPGMAPINNRYAVGANRQGWTFFQRKVNANSTGSDPVGWNFRMWNGVSGDSPLDTTAVVPFEVGKWVHLVAVYDPASSTEATVTMYVNGVPTVTNHLSGQPLYQPCTGDHDLSESPAGQPGLAIGCYNNCNTSLNPFFGGVDEFAWYSNALSAAQILSHYQNGTNVNRATPYDTLVKSHNPVVYLRLDEIAPSAATAVNLGDTRSAGLATHSEGVRYPAASALTGRSQDGASAYHNRNGSSTTTIPWLAENNPNAGVPFTFETWLRPLKDQQAGQCPINNRSVGGTGRTGWVVFQRNPNHSYAFSEGYGWNFRMYDGTNSLGIGHDVVTGGTAARFPEDPDYRVGDYTVGKWQHLVVTWEPQVHRGDLLGNGNDQWEGRLTAYVDGVAVATNPAAKYAANRQVPEPGANPASGGAPADFAVGSYNAASGITNNPYEGDVDEVAFYNGFVLTPAQILEHYVCGTNANCGANYETLVMTTGFAAPQAQRTSLPKTYLRFNDPARWPVANAGTLGFQADGNQVLTTNVVVGPRPPAYAGFEASNQALPLDGAKQWASFNNPADLNISGQITLEAWIRPGSAQTNTPACIIAHGPQTQSSFLGAGYDNAVTNTSRVFLQVEGPNDGPYFYTVGSATNHDGVGTASSVATYQAPAGDFGGGNWIHLVGTYDGANWNLYRNGAQVASTAAAFGALPVDIGDWAVGSTGNGWANNFAGLVDEVAIYSHALTPAQVANHYAAGTSGNTLLTIVSASGGNVTITWPDGTTLQEASDVTGPYSPVPGNPTSPLTIPASGMKFYRWSRP